MYNQSMTLDELKSAVVLYSSDKYDDFLQRFEIPINKLNYEDKLELYKDLYINVKYQNKSIPNTIIDIYKENGASKRKIKNILNNVKFDKTGQVTVYRGINRYNSIDGSSYTLSEEKAKWFSTRFEDNENVVRKQVKLEDIIFYSNNREEQEVFIFFEEDVTPVLEGEMPF